MDEVLRDSSQDIFADRTGHDRTRKRQVLCRMLSGKEEMERFEENRPCRAIDEQRDELRLIREQSAREMPEMHWDRVYVSEEDVIFPVENQRNWWGNRVEIITLPGGHYPFYVLDNWEKIWK